ncbi:MAG: dual specificity protein phosphatase family protein [Chloroflexi bacterium]|nr:dual specificity protein phosphatase family protein [Chloroflexota bacterium]
MTQWIPGVDADFVWVVPGLAVGAQPSRQQMHRLKLHGIDALLSVRAEDDPEDSPYTAKRLGLRYQRVVVADSIPIPLDALEEIACIVHDWRKEGLGVLIHCQAGRRRGPIAIAAVLVDEGWSVSAALRRITQARKQTAPTPDQVLSLRRFAIRRWHHRVIYALHDVWHLSASRASPLHSPANTLVKQHFKLHR